MKRYVRELVLVSLCLALAALPASAQVFTGRIDITVADGTGAILPGVTVDLTGPSKTTAVTDQRGEAHFLNLAPGQYAISAKLSGFRDWRADNVPVGAGSIVPLQVTLALSSVTASTEVVATTPVIETKKQTISTNVSLAELQNLPSARDPWVVLQTVPGVIVDRVNVGGAESGQQSNYVAKGAKGGENTWNIDGIAITDMAALGSTPTYYDFDMFQEMQVTTGGADPSTPTPGVQLNLVLRGGTSVWRGSTRYYFEDRNLQFNNLPSSQADKPGSYNRVNRYRDYGAELGGPLLRDRLTLWGAIGRTQPEMDIYTFGATARTLVVPSKGCGPTSSSSAAAGTYAISARDCTTLKNYAGKATLNIDNNMRSNFTFFYGDKVKQGRGAAATRPAETTWNQSGPTKIFRGELSRTFGNTLFLTGRYAYSTNGFNLIPQGGLQANHYRDDARVHHGSYFFYSTDRPANNVNVEGTRFSGSHELKFGFGWRKASVTSESGWPGSGIQTRHATYPRMTAVVVRDWAAAGEGVYWSGYLGDTISANRLTINAGVRWDRSISSISEASVPASPVIPNLLPALNAPAVKNAIVWNTVTPRVGLTYAVEKSGRTVARASYSQFASQLDSNRASLIASAIPYYSYVYYRVTDTNGNKAADAAEIAAGTFLGTAGFDPGNPLGGNPDKIGDYKTPMTHEVIVGLEHELRPNVGLSGAFTWRRYTNGNWLHQRGVTGSDYTLARTLTGSAAPVGSYSIPIYAVNPSALPDDNGRVYEVRDGYSQRYWGLELSAVKRMSNHWMMRAGFSTGEHTEHFDNRDAQFDLTPTVPIASSTLPGPNRNGGPVLTQTAGSGKANVYLVAPKFQYILTAAYEAKYGINLGLNYVGRQGFAAPYYLGAPDGSEDDLNPSGRNVLLTDDVTKFRLPMVHSLDARISKMIKVGTWTADLDVDAFNLLNRSTVLGRQYDLNATNPDETLEIMNPRIVRLGIRVRF